MPPPWLYVCVKCEDMYIHALARCENIKASAGSSGISNTIAKKEKPMGEGS